MKDGCLRGYETIVSREIIFSVKTQSSAIMYCTWTGKYQPTLWSRCMKAGASLHFSSRRSVLYPWVGVSQTNWTSVISVSHTQPPTGVMRLELVHVSISVHKYWKSTAEKMAGCFFLFRVLLQGRQLTLSTSASCWSFHNVNFYLIWSPSWPQAQYMVLCGVWI